MSKDTTYWADLALACFVPYVILLILADRMLTIRKGYALLSIGVIAVWAAVGQELAPHIADVLPASITGALGSLPTGRQAAIDAGAVALLIHLWPLWLGLRDRGDVAERLIEDTDGPRSSDETDIYNQRTAEFRGWRHRDEREEIESAQKESFSMKVLFGAAWVSIIACICFGYFRWGSTGITTYQATSPAELPNVRTSQPSQATTMHPVQMPSSPSSFQVSQPIVSEPGQSSGPMALPAVQRPTGITSSTDASNPYSGPNEAISVRARDGSFGFDAVVNGTHLPMLFDTGATVVALRAEDVGRFGITVPNLVYSAKVKTANGVSDAAPIIIDTLTVGNITQRHVVGYVAKEGVLPRNLLGQSFLTRLAGYNVENNQLVLKGR
jgi:clan AA aspartic protease (TIGR02281 family)